MKRAKTGDTSGQQPPRELRVCRAIRLLAQGLPGAEVAGAINVREKTLENWQQGADFQALLACMKENGRLRDAFATLQDLTPEAIEALHRALEGSDDRLAVQAAKDVLDRVGIIYQKGGANQEAHETIIRFEYGTPDGQPYTAPSWADRHPAPPGTIQGGGVRAALREDGDGQDHDA
ncbi:MAG: hypothetical protein JXA10_06550 [Anaerolineae bacterium]|nr:hypothetical protein [Anaerolineae bacterium]